MKSKTLIATLMLSLYATSSSAHDAYIGLGVGPEYANFKQGSRTRHPGDFDVKDSTESAGTGIFVSAVAGYGWHYKRFYIGSELNANASSIRFTSANNEFIHSSFVETTYALDKSFGLSLLPGFQLTPNTLFYTRAGYAVGDFIIHTSDTSLADVNKYISGFRFGFGVKNAVTEKLDIRLEYSQINYEKISFNVLDGTTLKSTNISPQTGQIEFGFIYKLV
jgi:outer membrane immunogenic protein